MTTMDGDDVHDGWRSQYSDYAKDFVHAYTVIYNVLIFCLLWLL